MSDLFAILYPDANSADSAMEALENLSSHCDIELVDACAVVKDVNGHVHLHQKNNLSVFGALGGLVVGTLLGWFILLPYLGIPAALIGALVGKVSDYGIKDSEMKDLSKEMKANTSAIFILMNGPAMDTVLKKVAAFGGRIFHTSLDKYRENELEERLEQLRNLSQQELAHPIDLHKVAAEIAKKEEEVIVTETRRPRPLGGKSYRLVWYYTQWPQGSEHNVLARGLSLEEAEELKEKKDPHLKGETLLIEEENENAVAEAVAPPS